MSAPFVLVQLSDPHLGGTWAGGDPAAGLAAAVAAVRELDPRPDAVLVSGDLTDHGTSAEYEDLRALLAPLEAPVHVLAGNHDDRTALRAAFGLPGGPEDPVQYVADLGPLRLVVLDTTVPGEPGGRLDGASLAWLDGELGAAPDVPAVLALHHPPVPTGIAAMDAIGLDPGDREALAAVVERHPQVRRLLAGHVHRAVVADLAGRAVLVAPSTYAQVLLDFGSPEITPTDEPRGFLLHVLVDGRLVSHLQPIAGGPAGVPG
jgi:3',5'-cyclic AMP phosphodiesterase CpdA